MAPDQAVASYAGVRPLYEDKAASNSTVTRDYQFEVDEDGPPLLSIFGGKLTTYRKLAVHALKRLNIGGEDWTASKPLPGGGIDPLHFDDFVADQCARYDWAPRDTLHRMARAYGTRMIDVIGDARGVNDLGEHMGGGLYARELEYLVAHEFAMTAEDVLTRRSKLYLHLTSEEQARVEAWFAARPTVTA